MVGVRISAGVFGAVAGLPGEGIIGPQLGFFAGIDYICACARCDGHCRRPAPAG